MANLKGQTLLDKIIITEKTHNHAVKFFVPGSRTRYCKINSEYRYIGVRRQGSQNRSVPLDFEVEF